MVAGGSLASTDKVGHAVITGARLLAGQTDNVLGGVTINRISDNADVTGNYTLSVSNGTLTVTARAAGVTLSSDDAEKNYDGTPLTANHYAVVSAQGADAPAAGGLLAGDTLIAVITGTITDPGQTDNTISGYGVFRPTSLIPAEPGASVHDYAVPTPPGYVEVTGSYTGITLAPGTLIVYDSLALVSADSTDVTCHGLADGTATFTVSGGKPDAPSHYNYDLAGPVTAAHVSSDSPISLTGLKAGSYTLTVRDGLDSTLTVAFTIREPDTLTAALTVPAAGCPNQPDYAVSVTVTGGNAGAMTYTWGKDANDVNASSTTVTGVKPDCGREYAVKVTVTDSKGCAAVDSATFSLNDTELPMFTFVPDSRSSPMWTRTSPARVLAATASSACGR